MRSNLFGATRFGRVCARRCFGWGLLPRGVLARPLSRSRPTPEYGIVMRHHGLCGHPTPCCSQLGVVATRRPLPLPARLGPRRRSLLAVHRQRRTPLGHRFCWGSRRQRRPAARAGVRRATALITRRFATAAALPPPPLPAAVPMAGAQGARVLDRLRLGRNGRLWVPSSMGALSRRPTHASAEASGRASRHFPPPHVSALGRMRDDTGRGDQLSRLVYAHQRYARLRIACSVASPA